MTPNEETSRKCWKCNGRGGHYSLLSGQNPRHWHYCPVCDPNGMKSSPLATQPLESPTPPKQEAGGRKCIVKPIKGLSSGCMNGRIWSCWDGELRVCQVCQGTGFLDDKKDVTVHSASTAYDLLVRCRMFARARSYWTNESMDRLASDIDAYLSKQDLDENPSNSGGKAKPQGVMDEDGDSGSVEIAQRSSIEKTLSLPEPSESAETSIGSNTDSPICESSASPVANSSADGPENVPELPPQVRHAWASEKLRAESTKPATSGKGWDETYMNASEPPTCFGVSNHEAGLEAVAAEASRRAEDKAEQLLKRAIEEAMKNYNIASDLRKEISTLRGELEREKEVKLNLMAQLSSIVEKSHAK